MDKAMNRRKSSSRRSGGGTREDREVERRASKLDRPADSIYKSERERQTDRQTDAVRLTGPSLLRCWAAASSQLAGAAHRMAVHQIHFLRPATPCPALPCPALPCPGLERKQEKGAPCGMEGHNMLPHGSGQPPGRAFRVT